METHQIELKGAEEKQIASRSLIYSLLGRGFRFPTAEFYERVRRGRFADEAQSAIANLPYSGLKGGGLGRNAPLSHEEFQSNYISLFDVGGEHGQPCSLYEGEYGGGRMKVMEEVLRFYHHFGLRLATEKRDRPDHLASELEFMHALSFKETEALAKGNGRGAYVSAERDFLRFHLGDLVASVASRVGGREVPFYAELVRLAESFCQSELAFLLSMDKGGKNG